MRNQVERTATPNFLGGAVKCTTSQYCSWGERQHQRLPEVVSGHSSGSPSTSNTERMQVMEEGWHRPFGKGYAGGRNPPEINADRAEVLNEAAAMRMPVQQPFVSLEIGYLY